MTTNTQSKIEGKIGFCKRLTAEAIEALKPLRSYIPDADGALEALQKNLTALGAEGLTSDKVKQDWFDLAKDVKTKAQKALRAARAHEMIESLTALMERAEKALHSVESRMPGAAELRNYFQETKESLGKDIENNADKAEMFLKHLLTEVGSYKRTMLQEKVIETSLRWMVNKAGEPTRFAEGYEATGLHNKVVALVNSRPSDYWTRESIHEWTDEMWKMLSVVNAPWGMCACSKNKLLPWKNRSGEWVPSRLCHDCYTASKASSTSIWDDKKPQKHQVKKKGSASRRHAKSGKTTSKREVRPDGENKRQRDGAKGK